MPTITVSVREASQRAAGRPEEKLGAAEDAAAGGNGVLPNGSEVKSPNASVRGSQPFQPRLQYLREQLILVGTGGLLNGLAVSGSGTLAGAVHA